MAERQAALVGNIVIAAIFISRGTENARTGDIGHGQD
jgi:hypothetical protein